MGLPELRRAATDVLEPLDRWSGQCHAASVHLVRSGVLGPSRVARGGCQGVSTQHSWVVLGDDCWARDARIIDPTLWSYDAKVEGVWVGTAREGRHIPFGRGSIWQWGRPDPAVPGEELELTPAVPWSRAARCFLEALGPLDFKGWVVLAHAPVEGWPAREIIEGILDTPALRYRVPIDIVGMLTDRNPSGLYLPEKATA